MRISPFTTESRTYNIVRIKATFEKCIEIPVEDDIDDAVDDVISKLDLSDFDYDYDEVGSRTELVDVYVGDEPWGR